MRSTGDRSILHALMILAASVVAILVCGPALAEVENDKIGFSPNHIFDGAIDGESVDILNGNVNLRIPIGPRYQLNDRFGYQLQLYYNSKIWTSECDASNDCSSYLTNSDIYGAGFLLHFGRIYHHPDDHAYIYRYQSPDGSERFFCDNSGSTCPDPDFANQTFDLSAIKIFRSGTGWEAYPGDGTRLVFGQIVNGGEYTPTAEEPNMPRPDGGWYVTVIETIAEASVPPDPPGDPLGQAWVRITYDGTSNIIASIDDSSEREFSFGAADIPNATKIGVPAFANSPVPNEDETADYILVWGSSEDFNDPSDEAGVSAENTLRLLREIHLPELNPDPDGEFPGEKYRFDYGESGNLRFGYLKSWSIPTGATTDYHHQHYRTSGRSPYHTEVVAKVLHLDGSADYTWTYTRFGNGVPKTWEEAVAMTEGESFQGSNPDKVKVLDPFGNLTVYRFWSTAYGYLLGQGSCDHTGCENKWWDGLPYSIATFTGPEEDPGRLVQSVTRGFDVDGPAVQFRDATYSDMNLLFPRLRVTDSMVVTYGGFEHPTRTRSTVYEDWTHIDSGTAYPNIVPKPRKVLEYEDGILYRSTYTDYDPTMNFHDRHYYVELRDAAGDLLSRTEKRWNADNRLECMIRRAVPTDTSSWTCADMPTDGSVITSNQYDEYSGSLVSRTVSGGDNSGSVTSNYEYTSGVLTKKYVVDEDIEWDAVDRDIDGNTGLVKTSRDPSGIVTEYTWDKLGRLKTITPVEPEEPIFVSYPSVHETHVEQTASEPQNNTGSTKSVYLYDYLGRVIQEQRKNIAASQDIRRTQYDIAGRVVASSEWADVDPEAQDGDFTWTNYSYDSPFINPDAGVGESPYFTDPLGRVSSVVRPDQSETVTEYGGLATRVTVSGIAGLNGPIDATTVYVNDTLGRLVEVDSPGDGADAVYSYDEHDRLREVQLIDPNPPGSEPAIQIRRFDYDSLGHLRSALNPENGTVHYLEYDERGNLLKYQDARGKILQNLYDAAGRLQQRSVVLEGGSTRTLVEHLYDRINALGKLKQTKSYRAEDGSLASTIDYFYEPETSGQGDCTTVLHGNAYGRQGLNGRLGYTETAIDPWGEPLRTSYCYNSLGLVSTIGYPSFNNERSIVRMSYTHGALHAVDDASHDVGYITDVQYYPGGAVQRIERGTGLVDEIDRDEQGRPLEFRLESDSNQTTSGRPPIEDLWGCGNNHGGPIHADYCDAPSVPDVIEWESEIYEYDLAGNISEIGLNTYRYDELNRLVHAQTFSKSNPTLHYQSDYVYDAFGNMIDRLKHSPSGMSVRNDYHVDRATNRLTSQFRNGHAISYSYDAAGNMLSEDNEGYLYDPQNRLTEVWHQDVGGDRLVAKYDYDANGYRLRAATEESETFYVRDGSGRLLSEFRRGAGDPDPLSNPPSWNKDYIYALGQAISLVKNKNPQTPGKPWATNVTSARLTVNWNPVEDPDLRHYRLERKVDDGDWEFISTDTATNDTDVFVSPWKGVSETVLAYRVTARDYALNSSAPSPVLTVRPFDEEAPDAPTITAGVESDRAVSLAWTSVEADDLWGYTVERIGPWSFEGEPGTPPAGMEWGPVASIVAPTVSYFDFNLTNGLAYRYRVRAVDTAGNMSAEQVPAEENEDEITLVPEDIMPPSRPIGVRAFPALAAATLIVRWDAVPETDLDVYLVERNGDVVEHDATTEFVDTGLTAGVTYEYRVVARDTSGNYSPWSDLVSAVPRDGNIDVPVLLVESSEFDPDENGTIAVEPPLDSEQHCEIDAEDDDLIRVRLEWEALTTPADYRVYRSDGTNDEYALISEVTESANCAGDPLTCIYYDDSVSGDVHTYYVVAIQNNKEGPAQESPLTIVDTFNTPVRNILAYDGRDFYTTENHRARRVTVMWSRVPEAALQGYHVYRRCAWVHGWYRFGDQLRDLSCTHSWVRLTASPVTGQAFVDWTTGDLREYFSYAVRPVSVDGVEGPWPRKVVNVNLQSSGLDNDPHCRHKPAWDIFNKHPVVVIDNSDPENPVFGTEKDRIDMVSKGEGDPGGPPSSPVIVDMNDFSGVSESVCACSWYGPRNGQAFFFGDFCSTSGDCRDVPGDIPLDQSNARFEHDWYKNQSGEWQTGDTLGIYAYIDWEQNLESDLVGYHVEMAGSADGPWVRVTGNPIAWWETHYDARLWHPDDPDTIAGQDDEFDWVGPACAVFRVIAVDESGLESTPSEPFQVAPLPEENSFYPWPSSTGGPFPEQSCSPPGTTLPAPDGLVASTTDNGGAGSATLLTWNQVPGAHAYRVYRNTLSDRHHWYFYVTAVVPNDSTECTNGVCHFMEEGTDDLYPDGTCPYAFSPNSGPPDCSLGSLDAFYVTAIDDASGVSGLPNESPRSNIVLWNSDVGYAWLFDDAETCGAIAESLPGDGERLWCEGPAKPYENTIEGDAGILAASILDAGMAPVTAPLLTLGTTNPLYEIYDLHVDHLGSTRIVTDELGEIVSTHDFLPFGEEIAPVFDYSTRMFTGHERDAETGLDYMLARYFDPELARFASVDPIGGDPNSPVSWNAYGYVGNNPLRYTDPSGEEEESVIDVVIDTLVAVACSLGCHRHPLADSDNVISARIGEALESDTAEDLDLAMMAVGILKGNRKVAKWLGKLDEGIRVTKAENGDIIISGVKKGGDGKSSARWYKRIRPDGTTDTVWKDNYGRNGKFKNRTVKKRGSGNRPEPEPTDGTGKAKDRDPARHGIDPDGPDGPTPHPCAGKGPLCSG